LSSREDEDRPPALVVDVASKQKEWSHVDLDLALLVLRTEASAESLKALGQPKLAMLCSHLFPMQGDDTVDFSSANTNIMVDHLMAWVG
jgi:hypothetical protein